MLGQLDPHFAGNEIQLLEWSVALVLLDVQSFSQHGERHAAKLLHGMHLDVPLLGEFDTGSAQAGFGLVAGFFREQVLGAGVQGAEAAGAAELGPLVEVVRAGQGETQGPHHLVRHDFVAQQVARAELGAVAALVAGRLPDPVHVLLGLAFAGDQVVVLGKEDKPGGSLGDNLIEIEGERTHHDAADENAELRHGGAARQVDDVVERRAQRDPKRLRLPDGAGDRNELVRDSKALVGEVDVVKGLDVVDHAADFERDTGGRDQPAGGDVNQLVFVAGGIEIAQQDQLDGLRLQVSLDGFDGGCILLFDAELALAGLGGLHHEVHPGEDLSREALHELEVFVDQGLALSAVGDHGFDLGFGLDVSGEACAASADHAELFQLRAQHAGSSIIAASTSSD